ncbi:probable ATP-dependent RNA helicase DDX47 [Scyliorhinus canicula]|uniref:probable ATP-dependent RNA helicase DDX47 n=1 Tax=Scyliorhinus canicula TaxID=7830 RepID=UPI0018F353C5|nr:probable ATP-dependent RNA helicase DDX47 [Scyliorhinus canicula]
MAAAESEAEKPGSFRELGVTEVLCEACAQLGWKSPTRIQTEALPVALQGRDIIGLAETGSGKTAAFALPILQALLEKPQRLFALVLTPTRELAFQISEQFEALGSSIGVKSAVVVGGIDMMSQSLALAKKPHVVIATPGRLIDHLQNTKGFNLRSLKYLVMDEADRILNMDFETEVDKILKVIPRERNTYLFSATMTKKVQKLQRAALHDPVKCAVSTKYQTVEKLQQYYVFIPSKFKDCYLVSILNEMAGNSFIIFCSTCNNTQRTALLLRNLGFTAIPLHGQMNQNKRLGALNKFTSPKANVIATALQKQLALALSEPLPPSHPSSIAAFSNKLISVDESVKNSGLLGVYNCSLSRLSWVNVSWCLLQLLSLPRLSWVNVSWCLLQLLSLSRLSWVNVSWCLLQLLSLSRLSWVNVSWCFPSSCSLSPVCPGLMFLGVCLPAALSPVCPGLMFLLVFVFQDYIHRVGRTARAGRSGKAITFVTQYDVELFQRIEHLIGKKLPAFPTQEEEVMLLVERVTEAQRFARLELREQGDKRKRPREEADDDTENSLGIRQKVSGGKMRKRQR